MSNVPELASKVPAGVDPTEFKHRVVELHRSMGWRNAISTAQRELGLTFEQQHAGLTGKALDEARQGRTLREQIADARRTVMAEEAQNNNAEGRGRKPDPKSDRRKVLVAALKAIQENGGPLSRKDLADKVKVRTKGKTSIGAWVGEACAQEIEVDGFKFVRTGRGVYGVEEVPAS